MLDVGIDQHERHLTICARDEQGNIVLQRQVSTQWEKIDRFLEALRSRGVGRRPVGDRSADKNVGQTP